MSKLSNEIKKTKEFWNSLTWDIRTIKTSWKLGEHEKQELLKTLKPEEIATIEEKRIKSASIQARDFLREKRWDNEYIEQQKKTTEYKKIASELALIMGISEGQARDVIENLDRVSSGDKGFMKKFIDTITNLIWWQTPLVKKINKTTKERQHIEEQIKKISGMWILSADDKKNLKKYLNDQEISQIEEKRGNEATLQTNEFLNTKKTEIEKLELSYKKQQELVTNIANLLDISETEVMNVLQYLNITWKQKQTESAKDSQEAPIAETPKKVPADLNNEANKLRALFGKILDGIQNHKVKIAIAASLLVAIGWTYKISKQYVANRNVDIQNKATARNKILNIDTTKVSGYKEKNDTITIGKFLEKNTLSMDPTTLKVVAYPWEKIDVYSNINDHYIKDKDQVIFYYNRDGGDRHIRIDWAEAGSFVALNWWFATDKYAKDMNHVYMVTFDINQIDAITTQAAWLKWVILDNADPSSFKTLWGGYTKDKNHAYYDGEIIKEVKDVKSFTYLGWWITKDKNHVYKNGEMVAGIDAESFKPIDVDQNLFQDKNWAYDGTLFLKWIDKGTVKRVNEFVIRDKTGTYMITQVQRTSDKKWETIVTKTNA